ncbi:hypothetical protein GX50_04576 [[Emmonsia] crescens]|uniref:CFEM domain-containing protein n=1 Tax=[Emmonsia] crescens TaxID=73230 RepID=A0A2B7ZHW7_9EURO|nr:hypothetical protein GX50_04576 [Emmonsia crescens]
MRVSHAFTATVVIAVDFVIGANVSDCANNCFQTAVNNHACDKWLSDPDCCESKDFISSAATCLSQGCSPRDSKEAWTHLAEQCDKVNIDIPPDYANPFPRSSSATSTQTTAASTSTSSPAPVSTTTTETTETLPTKSPITGTSTIWPSSTAIPGDTNDPNDNNGRNGSGGLSTAAKVAIGVTVPLAILSLLVALFLWLRRRRKKPTPSSTEIQNTKAQEIKPLVYEISGTEISRSDHRYDYAAELEADDTSRGRGPILPISNANTALALPHMNSDTNQDGHAQHVGELGAGAGHTASINRPPNPGSWRTPEPAAAPLLNTPSTSPVTPSSPPIAPIQPSSTVNFSPQRMSLIESSINASPEEARKIQGLLSNLEAVEQRKRESASRAQMLEKEEAAVRAEEQALLEEIRKKTGNVP